MKILFGVVILVIISISYFFWFAPKDTDLATGALVPDNLKDDKQLASDLHFSPSDIVELVAKKDSFYRFEGSDPINGGGGYFIVKRGETGFVKIFQGQDSPPPCGVLDSNLVPPDLFPYCVEHSGHITDRTNFIRTVVSRYFGFNLFDPNR